MEASAEHIEQQRRLAERLRRMRIQTKLLEGERTVLASMPMRGGPLQGLDGPIEMSRVLFASIGVDRIKCLRPRALFQLPLIRILGCGDSRAIEERIRETWRSHMASLGAAAGHLADIGIETRPADGGSTRVFAIDDDGPGTIPTVLDRARIALPSSGAMAGIGLASPEERVFEFDPSLDSSIEFEIALTTHMERNARTAIERLEHRDPYESLRLEAPPAVQMVTQRSRRLLLVGPRLFEDRTLAQKLRRRGFEVLTARGERDAVAIFDQRTPDLVMADAEQDRADGVELVVRLGELSGVEEAPVVLVDDRVRPHRRDTARAVGAAGYLVRPIEINRLVSGLSTMIDCPRARRFSRFCRRVSVSMAGLDGKALATTLGRRGMEVAVDRDLPIRSLQRFRLSIPEIATPIDVEAEVLYHGEPTGRSPTAGVRFERFAGSSEAEFIRYLKTLAAAA